MGQPSEAEHQEDAAKGMRPGRGLVRGTPPVEFQAALPTAGLDDKEQASKLLDLADRMNYAWEGVRPQPIDTLPLLIPLPLTDPTLRDKRYVTLGKDFAELKPVGFSIEDDGPAFFVAGVTQQTGKTTLLHSWVLNLIEHHHADQLQLVLVDFHTRSFIPFRKLPNTYGYISSDQGLATILDQMEDEMRRRRQAIEQAYNEDNEGFDRKKFVRQWPHFLTVIDDYELFYMNTSTDSALRQRLAEAVKASAGLGYSFLIAGTLAELPKDYNDPFIERFRKGGAGILLGGIEGIEDFNNTRRLPSQPAAGLPPGRGYLIRRGRAQLIQCMTYWKKDEDPADALAARVKQNSL